MPIVKVEWYAGRSKEQKQELAERITDLMVEVGKTEREHVWIQFVDFEKSNWAMNGELQG